MGFIDFAHASGREASEAPLWAIHNLASKVLRLVARLPFDIATDAGLLVGRNGLAREHGIQSGAEIFTSNGNAITGAAIIKLAAIDQSLLFIEQIKIRGA